jgi:CheY-like chemotaxis protein
MDCRMPVMDGYAATRHIRRLPGSISRVPVLALTASALNEDRQAATQAGMDDYLTKPFKTAELVQKCLAWVHPSPLRMPHVVQNEGAKGGKAPGVSCEPELAICLSEIFLETAPPVIESLLRSLENQQWEEARHSAHWLQGGAARLLYPDLQEKLKQLERACARESCQVSSDDLVYLRERFRASVQKAEEHLANRPVDHAIA